MRIVHNNVADLATIVTLVSGTRYSIAGGTINGDSTTANANIAYLQNDYKSQAYRAASASTIQIILTWTTSQTVGCVALPCTNLSKNATIQVLLYTDPATGSASLDSGSLSACTNTPLANWTRTTTAPDANSFAYGGVSKTAVWFPTQPTNIKRVQINITDTGNLANNIDIARIVCGSYWQSQFQVDRSGLTISVQDTSSNTRTDAGELVSDQGYLHDQLSFNLGLIPETDRNKLVEIIRSVGVSRNIFVSIFQESNSLQEQQYSVYGKRDNSAIDYVIAGYYSHQLSIVGW